MNLEKVDMPRRLLRLLQSAGNFGPVSTSVAVASGSGDKARSVSGAKSFALGPVVRLGWGAISAHSLVTHPCHS